MFLRAGRERDTQRDDGLVDEEAVDCWPTDPVGEREASVVWTT